MKGNYINMDDVDYCHVTLLLLLFFLVSIVLYCFFIKSREYKNKLIIFGVAKTKIKEDKTRKRNQRLVKRQTFLYAMLDNLTFHTVFSIPNSIGDCTVGF